MSKYKYKKYDKITNAINQIRESINDYEYQWDDYKKRLATTQDPKKIEFYNKQLSRVKNLITKIWMDCG